MGSRERTQDRPPFTSKIKRFPLVLKEKREIRGQGRKALAYDASTKFVHITMKRDAFCWFPSQNKRETHQRMHLLNLICCEVVLLTP